jgi:hypothetical protein
MKTGIELITVEREEHVSKHGRTVARDAAENSCGELRRGAIALICGHGEGDISELPQQWDDAVCRHMMRKSLVERLAIAGSLIAAEIDRLQAE